MDWINWFIRSDSKEKIVYESNITASFQWITICCSYNFTRLKICIDNFIFNVFYGAFASFLNLKSLFEPWKLSHLFIAIAWKRAKGTFLKNSSFVFQKERFKITQVWVNANRILVYFTKNMFVYIFVVLKHDTWWSSHKIRIYFDWLWMKLHLCSVGHYYFEPDLNLACFQSTSFHEFFP